MSTRLCLGALFLLCLLSVSVERELQIKHADGNHIYNHTLTKRVVEYASAVYVSDLTALFTWTCSRCRDMTMGFEMVGLIVDVQNCLQAIVGVDHDLKSVVIAFRGTQERSIQNWIEDLFWKQLEMNYPDMPDAMVHHGFYSAYHNTSMRHGVTSSVKRTRNIYGDLPIMVTGHSMGGAMASFCALDLVVNHGVRNVQLITFGQPRVGNAVFASCFSKLVPKSIRVTNGHDIVPHLPPYYPYFSQKTYHHFPIEVWLHDSGLGNIVSTTIEEICDDSGEDPSCSRSVTGNSIVDHLVYYDIPLKTDSLESCSIIMDKKFMQYHVDHFGNIFMSRDPNLPSFLELASQNTASSSI